MTNSKNTKKALFSSMIALILCCSMLIGTTFAWFTDEVNSGVNQIIAGNLDVDVLTADGNSIEGVQTLFNSEDGKPIKWEPGVVAYENLTVVNKGNLALKYQMSVNFTNEVKVNGKGLSDVLKVAVVTEDVTTREAAIAAGANKWQNLKDFTLNGEMEAGDAAESYTVIIYWEPSTDDNDYNMNNENQGKVLSIDLGINLFATQLVSEEDSFNKYYDQDAAVFTVAEANAMLAENKDVTLVNCIEPNGILYVPAGYTGTLTLCNVSIASIQESAAATVALTAEEDDIQITATNIVILGNVVVKATENGMSAITGTALNITGTGNLTAVGEGDHAYGIGATGATVSISGITIDYVAGGHVYGVGTDTKYYKDAPTGAPAIGGANITLENVTIIKAIGGSKAAGIGAIYWNGTTVNINNSTIGYVEGGVSAAGIGGSRISSGASESGTTINITNSSITAQGGAYGAGIGSGYDTHCNENQPICTINISGSTINATGGQYAAGVGTGYHHAALTGEIKDSTVNAVSGEKVYKDTYTSAMDIGFGVVDPTREGAQTDSYIIYMDNRIGIPAVMKVVKLTPDDYAGVTIASDTKYTLVGDFNGKNVSLVMAVGVENVTFDGSSATNINELIITQNGALIDNANTPVGERSGNVTVQNFKVLSQINVFACKTEVVVQNNTAEALMIYAGNCAVKVLNNTIDANFESHPTYRDETTTWNTNKYGIMLNIFDYNLWLDGNTVTNSMSHAVGINGWEGTIDNGDENVIESFTDNTITVNVTNDTKRAAFKVWDDETYASNDDDTNAVNATAQAFIDAVLKDGSNTFNITEGYDHSIFCFYNVNTNN